MVYSDNTKLKTDHLIQKNSASWKYGRCNKEGNSIALWEYGGSSGSCNNYKQIQNGGYLFHEEGNNIALWEYGGSSGSCNDYKQIQNGGYLFHRKLKNSVTEIIFTYSD